MTHYVLSVDIKLIEFLNTNIIFFSPNGSIILLFLSVILSKPEPHLRLKLSKNLDKRNPI